MTSTQPRIPDTRLVVTGHAESGAAIFIRDQELEASAVGDGTYLNPLWSTHESPADIKPVEKNEIEPAELATASTGSFFSAYDLPPGYSGPLHRSHTIDYIIVVRGTVALTTEQGSCVVCEGDAIVQRGTMHSWSNDSDKWARLVSVMLPAKPVVLNGKELQSVWPL
jgi:quercetin dioxygenase-like cupin family protein